MTITSARRPTLPPGANSLWTLAVPWKTRAIRSAATAPSPKARFPTAPWTPHAAPTGTTGNLIDAH